MTPAAVPAEPTDELKAAIAKVASRVPHIAALFGIDASAVPKRKRPPASGKPPRPPAPPKVEAKVADAAAPAEAPVDTAPDAVAPAEAVASEPTPEVVEEATPEAAPEPDTPAEG